MLGAPGVRQPHAAGAGDASDRPGSRGVGPDGRRPEPDDRADVPARRRCSPRAAGVVWGLRFGYVRFDLGFNSGLKAFTAAVLGGIGNITRRRPRRVRHRLHRELRLVARLLALVGVPRVHDPDVRPDLQADRHPRPGHRETAHDRHARPRPRRRPARRRRGPGCATSPTTTARRRSSSRWSIVTIADDRPAQGPAAVASSRRASPGSTRSPTPACSCSWRWASTSSSAWPACSTWATRRSSRSARTPTPTRNSPFSGLDLPFLPMLVVGAAVAAVFGIAARRADPPPARRLPRDHDPRLRRDRPDRVPQPRHRGRRARTASAASTGRSRCRSSASSARLTPFAYFILMVGDRDDRDDPALSAPGFADRPSLERRSARTSWRPRPTASTRSPRSSWPSRSARRRPAWPASSTPRS